MNPRRQKMLLHMCCAGCSPYVIELLKEEYDVTGFFYNPNIHPREEYQLRLKESENLASKLNIELLSGKYDADQWFTLTKGMENEPEGGRRCEVCFQMRLETTAQRARQGGFPLFDTTLTVSPHKDARCIHKIGLAVAEQYDVDFLESNFKKKDGFAKTAALSKRFGLYRQNYCGCLYSRKKI